MLKKHIIFDIDGTLIDTEKRNSLGLQKVLKENAGLDIALETLYSKMGGTGRNILRSFDIDEELIDGYLEKWITIAYNDEEISQVDFFEGIEDTVKTLHKKGISLGIVTSKTRELLALEHFPLEEYFGCMVLADDTSRHKPNPDPLLHYLTLTDSKAEDCIYIGDTYSDFLCATESNMDFGLALWGAINPLEDEKLTRFLSPLDILNIV